MRTVLPLLLLLAGCRPDGGEIPTGDAGVIETSARDASRLVVPESCALEIGRSGRSPAHEFFRIRAAYRLGDGRLVVVDGGANEVRYFDGDGRHVSTSGGEGDGPGEFQDITSVALTPGDSLE